LLRQEKNYIRNTIFLSVELEEFVSVPLDNYAWMQESDKDEVELEDLMPSKEDSCKCLQF
jgi:hypothetical protein